MAPFPQRFGIETCSEESKYMQQKAICFPLAFHSSDTKDLGGEVRHNIPESGFIERPFPLSGCAQEILQVRDPCITVAETQNLDQEESNYRQEEEWKNYLPVGFKFEPRDDELVDYYLWRKVSHLPIKPGIIADLNIYEHEPQNLHRFAYSDEFFGGKMYFFSPSKRKDHSKSKNERMVLDKGCWKASTKKSKVSPSPATANAGRPARGGSKAALVYYDEQNGKKDKRKQNWLMKEYRLPDNNVVDQGESVMTLCVIYYNPKRERK